MKDNQYSDLGLLWCSFAIHACKEASNAASSIFAILIMIIAALGTTLIVLLNIWLIQPLNRRPRKSAEMRKESTWAQR